MSPRSESARPPRCTRADGSSRASFRSPAKAKQAIVKQRAIAGVALYVFKCPHCDYWHHTSKPQRKS